MMNVKWKSVNTDSFPMENGTRQETVLSPFLFSVYMQDVSTAVTVPVSVVTLVICPGTYTAIC